MTTRRRMITTDGCTAAATIAYALSEVVCIYPITPSSPMGESADGWAAEGRANLWGDVPSVTEMQSEGGAAGAIHGSLTAGALSTTFTASQGLLLMIPNMYKIAGELTPTVFHVSARSLAAQGLSIFGDHADVMAARATGWCMLCSNTVQEVMDLALVAHTVTLEARLPFLHFFDGFRTSHEIQKIEALDHDDIRALVDEELVQANRLRGLTPDRPAIRGTAQNPDVYFQGRETVNPFYDRVPGLVQRAFDRLAERTGRHYHLFDYTGAPDAERVIVMMGSGCGAAEECVDRLTAAGEKVGVVEVRLFRPFDSVALVRALPATVTRIAVLDRTKEPGSAGEPLLQDVQSALMDASASGSLPGGRLPLVVGGRYGLGSKEFDPAMVKAVFDNLAATKPRHRFTVGIHDDVAHTSLPWDPAFQAEDPEAKSAMFFGLGADGTVGANKNSIKIIGKATPFHAQGYFVYDSKKSGSMTTSHLRFSPKPIRSSYLVTRADFVACHVFPFLERFPVAEYLAPGGVFLLNSPYPASEVWRRIPREVQQALVERKARFYVIDAYGLARELGLGGRINIVMQAAFFSISGVIPSEKALELIEAAVRDTYGSKGPRIVEMNISASRAASERLALVPLGAVDSTIVRRPAVADDAPAFVREVTGELIAGRGDLLPVSKMPADGTWPVGTTRFEKRNIAQEIPVWNGELCIQCNLCAFVCPHATIRGKMYTDDGQPAPIGFKSVPARGKGLESLRYTIQVAPEDCTGCEACVHVCPAEEKDAEGKKTGRKAINMAEQEPIREREVACWDHFLTLEPAKPDTISAYTVKGSQLRDPLFEFSGACSGCGETPYIKLLTQLYGDRLMIANATGCSSIYGGNLPTTPYTVGRDGRGPAWSNSLFEDNAEFGLGMRLGVDAFASQARLLLQGLVQQQLLNGSTDLAREILEQPATDEAGRTRLRALVDRLKTAVAPATEPKLRRLFTLADYLVPKSVWCIGGDGWSYDIGSGGLDHVLSSGRKVNILVLDTGVYSNTGGQSSKATPRAAVAKFASSGKEQPRKDLGAIMMTYGTVYVASIAYGANPAQAIKALREAEEYDGPSLVIAYSHCIAHGIDMSAGTDVQKEAVSTGFWPLFRFDPRLTKEGKNPFQLDSKEPTGDVVAFANRQGRFRVLTQSQPQRAEQLLAAMRNDVESRWRYWAALAKG